MLHTETSTSVCEPLYQKLLLHPGSSVDTSTTKEKIYIYKNTLTQSWESCTRDTKTHTGTDLHSELSLYV